MRKWIARQFGGRKTKSGSAAVAKERLVKEVGRFTGCTFCHSEEFYEGPSGGASQNIMCAKCGARFNIGLVPGGPVLLDVLAGPTEKADV